MLNKNTKTMGKTVVKTKFEYADNGIIIRYGDLGNAPEVYEKEPFCDAIKDAYGNIVNNSVEIEAEELHGQNFIGFEVKIEIKPIFKNKDLFFKE